MGVVGCSRRATRPMPDVALSPWFERDSPLEGAGFEPSVPRDRRFREALMPALLDSPPTERRRKREPMPRLRRVFRGTDGSNPAPSSRTSLVSLTDTGGQHRRRPMGDFLESQRRQRAALLVDAVRSQTTRRCACGKQEVPCRIKAERTRHSLGWCMPSRRQMPSLGIDSEGRNTAAVNRAVTDIEQPGRGRQVNLRAGSALTMTGRHSRGRLHGRESAVCAVDPVRGDAAALLVREVDDVKTRVMDMVTRSDKIPLFNAMWGIRAQPTGLSVEPILQDHVGPELFFGGSNTLSWMRAI